MKDQLKKKNILNLIRYYSEGNDIGFRNEAYDIARHFNNAGDTQLAEYIMGVLSGTNTFSPQENNKDLAFLTPLSLVRNEPLPLPTSITNDIVGLVNAVKHSVGIHSFLFEGAPGTGKTEAVKQVARMMNRSLFMVDFDSLINSRMGETQKNISAVFEELNQLQQPERIIVLIDEIDAIALDRVNSRDIREMGRVTSSFLKAMDKLDERIVLIATTNLLNSFDTALLRRFDATIGFDRYAKNDLVEVGEELLSYFLHQFRSAGRSMRLFHKILVSAPQLPNPAELRNLIKTSLAFSDPNNEYDYLSKIYVALHKNNPSVLDISMLKDNGYTIRETEVLTGMSKSQVARELSA